MQFISNFNFCFCSIFPCFYFLIVCIKARRYHSILCLLEGVEGVCLIIIITIVSYYFQTTFVKSSLLHRCIHIHIHSPHLHLLHKLHLPNLRNLHFHLDNLHLHLGNLHYKLHLHLHINYLNFNESESSLMKRITIKAPFDYVFVCKLIYRYWCC